MMRACIAWLIFSTQVVMAADPAPSVKFIENKSQWAYPIQFAARTGGAEMVLQPGTFVYYFLDGQKLEQLHERSHYPAQRSEADLSDYNIDGYAIHVNFKGANQQSIPVPFGRSSEYYNYFLGSDSCHWASKAYAYDGVVYPAFYEGINLKVYSSGNHVKYDFVIKPNGNPSHIQIEYNGATSVRLEQGDVYVSTPLAGIIEKKPVAWQVINHKKVLVECIYQLEGNRLSFHFPSGYDPCYELVIDPLLIFSTYSGSLADNWGSTATPGERGTLYSSGVTNQFVGRSYSGEFPATAGAFQTSYGGLYDIGILKYDSTGSNLLYASYLGGERSESPHSLVMNASEELIVLGTSSSSDFPTTANAFNRTFKGGVPVAHVVYYSAGSDIVLARISKDGSTLLASTYVGGTKNDGLNTSGGHLTKNYGDELRGDVIADKLGNIYVSSVTASHNFPVTPGKYSTYRGDSTDAILFKMDASLHQIQYGLYLGGSGVDASYTLKFDANEDIYIAGGTTSKDFPVTASTYRSTLAGGADGWMAKINNAGDSIYYATFTGTSSYDQVYFIDLNEAGEVYVYGQTDGNFPITPSNVYSNANSGQFVQKFDKALKQLKFSTVFGSGRGMPDISPTAFLVNECNNLYMCGWGGELNSGYWPGSSTKGMKITSNALQSSTTGNDFYFIVLTDDGTEFLYGTYLGGNRSLTHVDGGTSRFDKNGIVYHAVCSGCNTDGKGPYSDFPTTTRAWSRTNRSLNCNNAAFKFDLSSLRARLQTNSIWFNMAGLNKICLPDKVVFQNFSTGGETFEWNFGDGTKLTRPDTTYIVHQYKVIGRYTIWLKAIDPGTCKVKDSVSTIVDVFNAEAEIQDDDEVCKGSSYTLKASGGATYAWKSADGSFQSNLPMPVVKPADTTVYYIKVTESSGCVHYDTVQLNVIPLVAPAFEMAREENCFTLPNIHVRSLTDSLAGTDRIYFDFGDGTTSDEPEADHEFEKDGTYTVKLVAVREAGSIVCASESVQTIPVYTLKIPNVITPGNGDNLNQALFIQYGKVKGKTPADYGFNTSLVIYNRWGEKVYEAADYKNDWTAEGLVSGVYFFEVTVQDHATCKSWVQVIKGN
ncbi:MAG TPA: PKD domain-containing protein [Ohtaekwangia sp.]|uniref:DUF7948 domain-containing protein n=1 Tax=Ohtaekwangia sp. TaxID=2066019 RepID=UPI002F95A33C